MKKSISKTEKMLATPLNPFLSPLWIREPRADESIVRLEQSLSRFYDEHYNFLPQAVKLFDQADLYLIAQAYWALRDRDRQMSRAQINARLGDLPSTLSTTLSALGKLPKEAKLAITLKLRSRGKNGEGVSNTLDKRLALMSDVSDILGGFISEKYIKDDNDHAVKTTCIALVDFFEVRLNRPMRRYVKIDDSKVGELLIKGLDTRLLFVALHAIDPDITPNKVRSVLSSGGWGPKKKIITQKP